MHFSESEPLGPRQLRLKAIRCLEMGRAIPPGDTADALKLHAAEFFDMATKLEAQLAAMGAGLDGAPNDAGEAAAVQRKGL